MPKKLVLDVAEMEESFFEETSFVGIGCTMPGYRLAWLLNGTLQTAFARDPTMEVALKVKNEGLHRYFPIFEAQGLPAGSRQLLYGLKDGGDVLLPEIKTLDYLWMIQGSDHATEAAMYAGFLRQIPEIEMASVFLPEDLRSRKNLLV